MKAQLQKEADDDYLDDPIKLFDFELERVHYGIQSNVVVNSARCNQSDEFCSYGEVKEFADTRLNNTCESDCLPLFVKLVDFKKFPWYFRKSNTVLKYVNYFDLVSDSDCEEDVVVELDENKNDDIVLIEDCPKKSAYEELHNIDYLSKSLCKVVNNATNGVKDFEKQRALRQRNKSQVDFKRNKGLIGLTIKQKVLKNKIHDTKDYETAKNLEQKLNTTILSDEPSHITVAKKTLIVNCTIQEKQVSKIYNKSPKMLSTDNVYKNPNILSNLANNFLNDKLNKNLEAKILDPNINLPLDLTNSSNKGTDLSKHIKFAMKTNKYQNTRMKDILKHSIFTDISTNKVDQGNMKKVKDDNAIVQESYKIVQNKREAHSPILQCSSKKINKSSSECKTKLHNHKIYDYLINNTKNVNKPINKSNEASTFNINKSNGIKFNDIDLKTNVIKQGRYISEIKNSDHFSKNSMAIKDRSAIDIGNYNNDFSEMAPLLHSLQPTSTKAKTENMVQNIIAISLDNSLDNTLPIKIVSVQSIANSSKMTNKNQVSTNNHYISSPIRVSPCKSIDTFNNSKPLVNTSKLISYRQNKSNTDFNINQSDIIFEHNLQTSTTILKPKQQPTLFKRLLLKPPVVNKQEFLNMAVQCTPQLYYNTDSSLFHNLVPHQDKSPIASHQLSLPYHNKQCSQNNLPFQSINNGWQKPNIFPRTSLTKQARTDNIHPYQYPYPLAVPTTIQNTNVIQNNFSLDKYVTKANYLPRKSVPVNNTVISDDNLVSIENPNMSNKLTRENNSEVLNELNVFNSTINSKLNNDLTKSKQEMSNLLHGRSLSLDDAAHGLYSNEAKNIQSINDPKRSEFINNLQGSLNTVEHLNQTSKLNGYSPPILPIPTYDMIMDQINLDSRKSNGSYNNTINNENYMRKYNKCSKRKYYESSQKNIIKNTKRISLQEYKSRNAANVAGNVE